MSFWLILYDEFPPFFGFFFSFYLLFPWLSEFAETRLLRLEIFQYVDMLHGGR